MKKRFCILPILYIPLFEHWLEKQSHNGYKLIRYSSFFYEFAPCVPKERKYFIYPVVGALRRGESKYYREFVGLQAQYGVSNGCSAVNSNSKANMEHMRIIEIDSEKIDYAYKAIRKRRNNYLIRWFFRIFLIYVGVLTAFFITNILPLNFYLYFLIPSFLYCVTSVIIFISASKK